MVNLSFWEARWQKGKGEAMTQDVRTKSKPMTNAQLGQICDRLSTQLRKAGFLSKEIQKVLEEPGGGFFKDVIDSLRRRSDRLQGLISVIALVDWRMSPVNMLESTGCEVDFDSECLAYMPYDQGFSMLEIVFFQTGKPTKPSDVQLECAERGLTLADPCSLAKADWSFSVSDKSRQSVTVWEMPGGEWAHMWFSGGEKGSRKVFVKKDKANKHFLEDVWFAGVRR